MGATPWRFKSSHPHLLVARDLRRFVVSPFFVSKSSFLQMGTFWEHCCVSVGFVSLFFAQTNGKNSAWHLWKTATESLGSNFGLTAGSILDP